MVYDKCSPHCIYSTLAATALLCFAVWSAGCSPAKRESIVVEQAPPAESTYTVNINTAGIDELMTIPHVGERTAAKVIEYRERFGPFRRPEQLMLVEGISDDRFRRIRHLLRVE